MPRAVLLEPLTMSTMYFGLTSRFSAVLAHQLSFLIQTIRSSAWVLYMYGPVPTPFSLVSLRMSSLALDSQMCFGTIGLLYVQVDHSW